MTPQISLIIVLIISAAIIFGNNKLIKAWSKVLKSSLGKFLKVSVVVISSLFLLGLLITAVILINDIWENRLKKQDGFDGIKLGWTRDEVIFRKGNPTETEKRAGNMQIDKYSGLWVEYQDDKVLGISKYCDAYDYNKINGLACYDTLDKLLKIYGEPKDVAVSNDKTSRLYCYPNYNVCYEVKLASIFSRYVMEGASRVYLTPEQIKETEALNAPPLKLVPPEDLPDNLKPKIVKKEKKSFNPDEYLNEKENTDHCAPNLSKAERLKRLALKGNIRETGANTYTAGNGYVTFSYLGDLISCN
jgi:hypothetical protein